MQRSVVVLSLALALVACGKPRQLEIGDAWTRDTVGGRASAAVFMTIVSPRADRLIGASSRVARKTDLMTMAGGTGAMEMKYVRGIDLSAGRPVSLNAGGLHVWLADLAQPLRAGQTFPLMLKFEHAGDRQVRVSVVAPAAAPPMRGM